MDETGLVQKAEIFIKTEKVKEIIDSIKLARQSEDADKMENLINSMYHLLLFLSISFLFIKEVGYKVMDFCTVIDFHTEQISASNGQKIGHLCERPVFLNQRFVDRCQFCQSFCRRLKFISIS